MCNEDIVTQKDKSDREELIKQLYIIDEEEIFDKYIKEFRKWIALTKHGKVILEQTTTNLPQKLRVLLYIIGKKIAFEAKLVKEDIVTTEELSSELDLSGKVVSARASELKKENMIKEVNKGIYQLNIKNLDKILTQLKTKGE